MTNLPTARSRELGARLAEYRTKNHWDIEQLAGRLGWSQHKLLTAERGERLPSELDAAVLLTECGATRPERDAVLDLLDGRHSAGCWARPHGDLLPEAVPSVLFAHQQATAITCYHPDGIPVLLKCAAFITGELRQRFGTHELITRHELGQSAYLDLVHTLDEPPVCYMREHSLRSIFINEDDRLIQFQHMARLIRDGHAVIRVLPIDSEPAITCGGFSLLRLAEADPVVCVPSLTATLILEGEHVPAYQEFLADLDDVALSCQASTDLIVGLAGGLDAVLRPQPEVVLELVREAIE